MILALAIIMAAQAATTDPVEDACYDRNHSQQSMNRCAGDAFERADADLNRHWREIINHYREPQPRKLIREAQRSWLWYRDSHCELLSFHGRGGSMWPMLVSGCRADLTRQRNRELSDLLGQGD